MTFLKMLAVALFALPITAMAQAYPSKPVRLVVPYPPGGSTDLLARTVAARMTESWGQQVLVENRAGANGMVGSDLVAKAAPDGYSFVLGTGASHGLGLFLSKTMPYDPVKDFTPICAAVEVPITLAVHPSLPVASVRELIDYAKKNPGKLSFGSSGTGSPHHLSGELLKSIAGLDMVHVAYKGAGPAMQDLMGGQIPMVFTTLSTAIPPHKAGKIRILAVVEGKRQPSMPEIPTLGETVPGYLMPASWLGFFGPAGLPPAITARLNAEIMKAILNPEVKARLEAAGMPVTGSSPEVFARMVREDIETYRRIVNAAGIKPE